MREAAETADDVAGAAHGLENLYNVQTNIGQLNRRLGELVDKTSEGGGKFLNKLPTRETFYGSTITKSIDKLGERAQKKLETYATSGISGAGKAAKSANNKQMEKPAMSTQSKTVNTSTPTRQQPLQPISQQLKQIQAAGNHLSSQSQPRGPSGGPVKSSPKPAPRPPSRPAPAPRRR